MCVIEVFQRMLALMLVLRVYLLVGVIILLLEFVLIVVILIIVGIEAVVLRIVGYNCEIGVVVAQVVDDELRLRLYNVGTMQVA